MNKKLEEMIAEIRIAKVICGKPCDICRSDDSKCIPYRMARKLVAAGCRKQVEGEWIADEVESDCPTHFFHNYTCSVCGNHEQDRSPYCRECGAKMKGE